MDTKKSNMIYTLFLCITIPLFLFLLGYPVLRAKAYKSHTDNYNVTLELGAYKIKISDAAYLEDKGELDYMLSVIKEKNEEVLPEIDSTYLYFNNGDYENKTDDMIGKELSEMSELISIPDTRNDFDYIGVLVKYKENDKYTGDKVDEFGDIVDGDTIEGKTYSQLILIDKADITFLNSADYSPKGKEKSVAVSTDTSSQKDNSSSMSERKSTARNGSSALKADSSRAYSQSETSSSSSHTDISSSSHSDSSSTLTPVGNGGSHSGGGYSGGGYSGGGNEYPGERDEDEMREPETTTTHIETAPPVTTTTPETTTTTVPTTTQAPETQPPRITIHVDGIRLETDFPANNVILSVGNSHEIRAVISPDNADDKSVKWESNREDIAVVDGNGKITAVGNGKAIITATTNDGGLKASCMVTVS